MNETTHAGVPCNVVHLQGEKGNGKTCFLQKLPANLLRGLKKMAEHAAEPIEPSQVCLISLGQTVDVGSPQITFVPPAMLEVPWH